MLYMLNTAGLNESFPEPRAEILGHKPTVIIVQARRNEERIKGEQEIFKALADKARVKLIFVNPLTEPDRPWKDPKLMLNQLGADGVIFAGSADVDLTVQTEDRNLYVDRVTGLVKEAVKRGTGMFNRMPVFGICLGHEIIHQEFGGKVERVKEQAELGTGIVKLTRRGLESPYLSNIPLLVLMHSSFLEVFGHKDSVTKLAPGFKRLASTVRDKNSLTQNKGVFTSQGHLELELKGQITAAIELAKSHDPRMGDYEETYEAENAPGASNMLLSYFIDVAGRVESRKKSARRLAHFRPCFV